MPIDKLDPAVAHYLHAWNAKAVAVSPTGKVYATTDPTGANLAFWCVEKDAARLARAAEATGDVVGAAKRLGVRLTEHTKVVERARVRSVALDTAMRQAQEAGLLQTFNRLYRQHRLAAFRQGKHFMPYPMAKARLTNALVEVIAKGGAVDGSLVERALS